MSRSAAQSTVKGELIQKGLPCPGCTSSDAFAFYTDGHGYCFSEGKNYTKAALRRLDYDFHSNPGDRPVGSVVSGGGQEGAGVLEELGLAKGVAPAIKSRQLTSESCTKWGYYAKVTPSGHKQHVALYYARKGGRPVGTKIRDTGKDGTDKKFFWPQEGAGDKAGLFGQNLWGSGGRQVVITEGEIDAISLSQIYDHKWPVVSVPHGAAQAPKAVAANLEWLNAFERVIFAFDMDGPGQNAARECAALMPPGKAYIAVLPAKDINEALCGGQSAAVTKSIWNAKPYRPDGIIDARELTAKCCSPVVSGIPWPWEFMTNWTYGRRRGEVYTTGAGTGIGKTDLIAEIVASTISGVTKEGLVYQPEGFAIFTYETGPAPFKKFVAGKLAKRRFHIPRGDGPEWGQWTQEELDAIMLKMDTEIWEGGGKLFINDSKGASDWEAAVDRARFLKHSEGISHFVFEPISALVLDAEDERKRLDHIVMAGAALSLELEACIYFTSHLTRPDQGPSHEEGGQVRLKQFRGSNGIGMFSDFVIGMERNTQAEDLVEKTRTILRVVKDRYTGNSTGKTSALYYDTMAGTLDEGATNDDI